MYYIIIQVTASAELEREHIMAEVRKQAEQEKEFAIQETKKKKWVSQHIFHSQWSLVHNIVLVPA